MSRYECIAFLRQAHHAGLRHRLAIEIVVDAEAENEWKALRGGAGFNANFRTWYGHSVSEHAPIRATLLMPSRTCGWAQRFEIDAFRESCQDARRRPVGAIADIGDIR
jgi:hypothetical protein